MWQAQVYQPVPMVSKHSVTTRHFIFFLHKKWYQSVQQNRSFILNTHIPTRVPPPNPILSYHLPHCPPALFCLHPAPLWNHNSSPFAAIVLSLIKSVSILNPVLLKESTLKSKQYNPASIHVGCFPQNSSPFSPPLNQSVYLHVLFLFLLFMFLLIHPRVFCAYWTCACMHVYVSCM